MSVPALGLSHFVMRLVPYRLWLVVLPLVFGLAAAIFSYCQPPVFTAYARLLPPQTNATSAPTFLGQIGGGTAVGAASLALKNPSDLYASMLLSRTVQDDTIHHLALQAYYAITDKDKLRAEVLGHTKVKVGKDGIIVLSYFDKNPHKAAEVANALIASMYRVATRLVQEDNARRLAFYDGLIKDAYGVQDAADRALLEVELRTGITRLKNLEESSVSAMVELRGLIATREVDLNRVSQTATSRHPEVIRMQLELGALRFQLKQLESPLFTRTSSYKGSSPPSAQAAMDNQRYAEHAKRLALVEPARRNVEHAQGVIAQLVKAREFSRVDESRESSVVQVLDEAVAPTGKSGPRVLFTVITATFIGFLFTLMVALGWEFLFTDVARRERWLLIGRSLKLATGKIRHQTIESGSAQRYIDDSTNDLDRQVKGTS